MSGDLDFLRTCTGAGETLSCQLLRPGSPLGSWRRHRQWTREIMHAGSGDLIPRATHFHLSSCHVLHLHRSIRLRVKIRAFLRVAPVIHRCFCGFPNAVDSSLPCRGTEMFATCDHFQGSFNLPQMIRQPAPHRRRPVPLSDEFPLNRDARETSQLGISCSFPPTAP
jgi:hypothetical protein